MVDSVSPAALLAGAIVLAALLMMAQGVEEATGIDATPGQVRGGLAAVGAEGWLAAGAAALATAVLAPFPPAGRGIAALTMAGMILMFASGAGFSPAM